MFPSSQPPLIRNLHLSPQTAAESDLLSSGSMEEQRCSRSPMVAAFLSEINTSPPLQHTRTHTHTHTHRHTDTQTHTNTETHTQTQCQYKLYGLQIVYAQYLDLQT